MPCTPVRFLLLSCVLAGLSAQAHAARAVQPSETESSRGALASDIHGAADAQVRAAEEAAGLPEIDVLIEVGGVVSLADYAQVARLLSEVPGVRRVSLEEAFGDRVVLRATARGGAEALGAGLESSGILVRTVATGGRLVYDLRR